jgi:predicted nicotinamide N-methyase
MTGSHRETTLTGLPQAGAPGADQLHLTEAPLVPEVKLFLAVDAIVLWGRLEAAAGRSLPAPFWASAWAGGQALARHVLDHREMVAGRRVLDVASGSGLVAIAAAMADASAVVANDIDPFAMAAIRANARVNSVQVTLSAQDLLDGDGGTAEVILVADALYNRSLADRVVPFLIRAADRGAHVLVGEPGRGYVNMDLLKVVTRYHTHGMGAPEDSTVRTSSVLTVKAAARPPARIG